MKSWQSLVIGVAVCLTGIGLAQSAQALSISGRSSTEIEWYDNAAGDTAIPAYQYLQLNLKNIDNDGLEFRGYGRVADDLAEEVETESRLYYAYFEKRNLYNRFDLKLGRQFISTTAGASLMDGLYLKARDLGPFSLTLFGGGDVAFYESYDAKDLIDGLALNGQFLEKKLEVGLAYTQKWEESELTHELAGFNLDWDVTEKFKLYGDTQYNLLVGGVNYFNGGVLYQEESDWSLRAEYLYSLPVFSSTSIYSVFAVDEYREIQAELSLSHGNGVRSFVQYTRELYEEVDDADVLEAGVEKIRTDRFSGYLSGIMRNDDDGQNLYGVKVRGAFLVNPRLQVGAGAHVDVLERRIEEEDESTSSRLWIDATAYCTKKINVEAKIERAESDLWDEYYRGRVRLNILF